MDARERDALSQPSRTARSIGAIEAMVYAVVFAVAMAFVAMLFGAAAVQSRQASVLEQAIELASETAEAFRADPVEVAAEQQSDGLTVTCAVDRSPRPFGFLYEARIEVREGDAVVYERTATRYVSARTGGDQR